MWSEEHSWWTVTVFDFLIKLRLWLTRVLRTYVKRLVSLLFADSIP
jgi:hypothetical protein